MVSAQQDPPTPTFTNVTVHDPSVMRAGETFYVYGSHMASASSMDLLEWTQISTSAAFPNSLIRNQNPQTEFSEVLTWAQTNTFWAPDCIRLGDGRYYMYYCACRGDSPRSAMGLAVADSPTGPFSHVAVLLRSGMSGTSEDGTPYDATLHPNVVDPSVFFDQAGKLWMVYGSYSGGIYVLEMDPATGRQLPGQGYGKKLIGGNHSRIEGPYIVFSPETDYYYLFLSFGGLDSTGGYNVRVGRSLNPDGPYRDANGTDLTNVKGAPGTFFDDASIAPHGVKLMGGYQFLHVAGENTSTSRGYLSPGHNSVYRDPDTGKYFLVFHTRFVGRGEQHEVRVHQMFMNSTGWPVVAPHRYANESLAVVDETRIPGDYKLINHGKTFNTTAIASTLITLHPDRTITGSVNGTWQLIGDYDITLALSGVIYRGVFVRQWDGDNLMWVTAFTALSDNGTAWWGSKVATPEPPTIVAQPAMHTAVIGSNVKFSVGVNGTGPFTYQWRRNGVSISGATGASLTLTNIEAGQGGNYSVFVSSVVGSVTSNAASLTIDTTPRLINVSCRGLAGAGDSTLVAGFYISGTGTKTLLIRGVGPKLLDYIAPPVVADPRLTVFNSGGVEIASNNDWAPGLASDFTRVGAFALDTGSKDAAFKVDLQAPGLYTVHLVNTGAAAEGLIEVYDFSRDLATRLTNVSCRVDMAPNQLIVLGTALIGGQVPVLARHVGPELGLPPYNIPGVLPDPDLRVYFGGTEVAYNDDWELATRTYFGPTGAFNLTDGSKDAAARVVLNPGGYTVHATGKTSEGIALIEIYESP
jgi:beta-xylosidase